MQIVTSLLAIPAFLPIMFCPGYFVGWLADVHGFRKRSLIERIFWSLPLSLAVTPIASVLIGKFCSLWVVVALLVAAAAACVGLLVRESAQNRRSGRDWNVGWRPLGGVALVLACAWTLIAIFSLVDIENGHGLYMSLAIFDHAPRVNWTESVLRTGIPPDNPLYYFKHTTAMRYYYFWYVLCAATAKLSRLPVRAVFTASCVWSGFALAALIGLYLKHFLDAGRRLRSQFLRCIGLLTVTGLGICVNVWNLMHIRYPYIEVWPAGQITSWYDTLLYDPHHMAGLVCCMFAFLLAWIDDRSDPKKTAATAAIVATALASAFGISIYVTFGFFVIVVAWGVWQLAVERRSGPVSILAAGGGAAFVLLLPYLWELSHTSSDLQGGSLFAFSVREMIPPGDLMANAVFQRWFAMPTGSAINLAKLMLLAPGYAVELGFYLAVLLIYIFPRWRGRIRLSQAQRSLVFLSMVTLPLISLVRSGVLETNDFGWRAALLLQFPLLLLGSEVITAWSLAEGIRKEPVALTGLPHNTPYLVRSIAAFALIFGVITTAFQVCLLRFEIPLAQRNLRAQHDPEAEKIPHNAYISSAGYAALDRAIPHDAIVQFNPAHTEFYWLAPDLLGINRQMAIAGDILGCGSELGGDPRGCPLMARDVDAVFRAGTADQARQMCRQYGIQYLVTRIYDPVWNDKSSWVWTLPPAVSDPEFRAVHCSDSR